MQLRFFFALLCSLLCSISSYAYSARRAHQEDWKVVADRTFRLTRPIQTTFDFSLRDFAFELFSTNHFVSPDPNDSPYGQRKPLSRLSLDQVPEWTLDARSLTTSFVRVRDERFLNSPHDPNFMRRLAWQYPDDGCSVRAEWMDRLLEKMGYPEKAKIFAFGNLVANTPHHGAGFVSWWYHVAVGYRFQNQVYVFDPSIEAHRPLTLKEWGQRMGATSDDDIEYAICDDNTSGPYSPCQESGELSENQLIYAEEVFLDYEWARAIELKRDPVKVLGDEPPWLQAQ